MEDSQRPDSPVLCLIAMMESWLRRRVVMFVTVKVHNILPDFLPDMGS